MPKPPPKAPTDMGGFSPRRAPVPMLRPKNIEAVAAFFGIFWAAIVLNPRGCQSYRGLMVRLGLVKRSGRLALTPSGKRVLDHFQQPKERKHGSRLPR